MNNNQLIEKFETDVEEIWKNYNFGKEHMKGMKEKKLFRLLI